MKTTENEIKWFDNNPFFPKKDGYDEFVKAMTQAARQNKLPLCLEHSSPEDLTINDIKQLSLAFRQGTGLSLECQLYTCQNCGRLHCNLIVDQ